MDQELKEKFDAQEKKLDEVHRSIERIRKYFLIMLVVALVSFVLPLIGLAFAIPQYIQTLSSYGL